MPRLSQKTYRTIGAPDRRVFTIVVPCAIISALAFIAADCGADNAQSEYERLMNEARRYDAIAIAGPANNRDLAVETYRRAIQARGEHPSNVDVEFRIAELLMFIVDPPNKQDVRRDEALRVFEGVLERYPKSNMFTVRSAILAGDLHVMEGENDTARALYHRAIEGLAEAYLWRKSQSANPYADDFDLFNAKDRVFFTVAASQYVGTFGRRGSPERLVAYRALARDFAGTPFERIALKNEKALTGKLSASAQSHAANVSQALVGELRPLLMEASDDELREPFVSAARAESTPARTAAHSDGLAAGTAETRTYRMFTIPALAVAIVTAAAIVIRRACK